MKEHEGETIFYHVGIIDYFQLFNLSKKVEKLIKGLMQGKIELDTSS